MSEEMKEIVEKKKSVTKKEDKKYLIIMLVLCVLGGVGGFFIALLIDKLKDSGVKFFQFTDGDMQVISFVVLGVFLAVNIVLAIIGAVCTSKAKMGLANWDGEDEEVAEKIEGCLGLPLVLSSIVMILNMFFFSVCAHLDINSNFSGGMEDILLFSNIGVFVLAMVVVVAVQKKCLDLTKDMNPEKKGSIYDAKFSKKWMDSCDEAQQLQIYKAGSAAFQTMGSVCMTMWLVCIFADLFFNIGLMPAIVLFAIWISGIISYHASAIKEENKKKSEKE